MSIHEGAAVPDEPDDLAPLAPPLARTDPDAVETETVAGAPVPEGYPAMVAELRELLDRVASTAPDAETVAATTKAVAELNAALAGWVVDESRQLSGRLLAVPGRAQLAVPAVHVDELDDHRMAGRVRFGRHFLGSGGAVHGGAIPLVFDDLLGRLAIVGDRTRSRTAFLHVEYRSVTPIDVDLRVEAWIEREEGRKRHLRGTVHHGDVLCAEATALFVALRPGQP